MPGSTFSVSGPNIILNTIVAEVLSQFADQLESSDDFTSALNQLVKNTYTEHKRIIFNGNNYSEEWVAEAKKRRLLNLKSTPDALPYFVSDKNIELFTKHKIFTSTEMHSRYEILMESYCKTINIEALTMVDMVKKQILPAVLKYSEILCKSAIEKKTLLSLSCCEPEESLVNRLSNLAACLYKKTSRLDTELLAAKEHEKDLKELADYYRDVIFTSMQELRAVADELEALCSEDCWPYPTYSKLLFYI